MAAAKQGGSTLTHEDAKSRLKAFLIEFCIRDSNGRKDHVYGHQLTKIANRDQVSSGFFPTLDVDGFAAIFSFFCYVNFALSFDEYNSIEYQLETLEANRNCMTKTL